ncbi:MAG: choice-of-anchor J domain-containing protein, partial [Candidatus Marinimicrobia bacterium]|nr:choice-of-anchor J domain-containing protein [Candidatus Neomarinimicrobiota bacterium]
TVSSSKTLLDYITVVDPSTFRTAILYEDFEATTFPPDQWGTVNTHATNNWKRGNLIDAHFSAIDTASTFSAICIWIAENQDEWLITPAMTLDTGTTLSFYVGHSTSFLVNATIKLNISTDGGTNWTQLWAAADDGQGWKWRRTVVDLTAYDGQSVQLGWQYVGNDGDLVALDSIFIFSIPAAPADDPPAAPTGLIASAGNQEISFSWTRSNEPDMKFYSIYFGESANPTVNLGDSSSPNDTAMVVTGLTNGTIYYARVTAVDSAGNESGYSNEVSATPAVLALGEEVGLPQAYALHPNHPNPFNPGTTIRFDLPEMVDLKLVVYDLRGRSIASLSSGQMPAGYHQVRWNGRDRFGRSVPSGTYIARLITPDYTKSIKMVLLK